jgi:hypothetical protein
VPVDEVEGSPDHRGRRLTVADEDDLGRPGWWREPVLTIGAGFRAAVGHGEAS